jgi:hypothetical protein
MIVFSDGIVVQHSVAMSQREKRGGEQSTAKEPIGVPSLI